MRRILIFTFLFLFYYCSAEAETVSLKSGKSVVGKIVEKTEKYLKIDMEGIPITYYSDEIESIAGDKDVAGSIEEQKSALKEDKETSSAVESFDDEIIRKTKPANLVDVIGKWEMFFQKNGNRIPNDDDFVVPYQRFHFFPDGYFTTLALREPFYADALAIWELAPKSSMYKFSDHGVLLIKGSSGDISSIMVSIVIEDFQKSLKVDTPKLKKGDLLFSYIRSNKEVYLIRYLRKID